MGKSISSGDFNDLHNYNKYLIHKDTIPNIPVDSLGKLIVEKYSLGYTQLYFPDNHNAIYYRRYYNTPSINPEFSNWENILIDYNSRNLITNGYIIFKNNLIIQWGHCFQFLQDQSLYTELFPITTTDTFIVLLTDWNNSDKSCLTAMTNNSFSYQSFVNFSPSKLQVRPVIWLSINIY